MSDAPASGDDDLARLVGIAAARLLRRLPTARDELGHLAGGLPEGVADPQSGPDRLVEIADRLYEDLAGADTPFGRIARACALSAFDLDLFGLALLPALDDRAARVIAGFAGVRRLSSGVALRLLLGDELAPAEVRAALWNSPLWRHGLLRPPAPEAPVTEWPLDPAVVLLAVLDGARPPGLDVAVVGSDSAASEADREAAVAVERWIAAPDASLLHLAGPLRRGEELLSAAAPEALIVRADAGVPPWRLLALISVAERRLPALAWSGATELSMPPDDLVAPVVLLAPAGLYLHQGAHQRPPARITVPPGDRSRLAARWREAIPQLDADRADMLANQSWMGPRDIAAIAARAEGDPDRLAEARMALTPPRIVRLATLRAPQTPWERLVLDPVTDSRLEDFVRRYRLRVPVRERWGLPSTSRGLVALLSGDSGVGKTLATDAIATRLGLPVMHVDLSLVVSKYIGETEKNLSELFAAAEGFSALLFFDEADALFGRRTSVEDAHDRYANIEVNFLLQRLEAFEGIAVLASNLAQGIDEAFLRRIDIVIPMPRPPAAQRLTLWRLHLPSAERLAPGLPLDTIARHCEMTGGEIRNAATSAAYLAADGGRVIDAADLRVAILSQYAKKGRPPPLLPMPMEGAA